MDKNTIIVNLDIVDNKIKISSINKNTYDYYEKEIYEKDNLEKLYYFFLKCFNYENGHKFSYIIDDYYIKIKMESIFNEHYQYDLKLEKKVIPNKELLNSFIVVVIKQNTRIEELNYENIKLKDQIKLLKMYEENKNV